MIKIKKQEIIDTCISLTEARLTEIRIAKDQSEEAIREDTKSSAGDKYETTREMVQQDLNRYQAQLQEAKKDLHILQSLVDSPMAIVALGAIVQTDLARYFIASSIGLLKLADDSFVYVISPSSPVGLHLLGKRVGESITFNGKSQKIMHII